MAGEDYYAAAKTGLRDNVKLLVAAAGGIGGLLLAGTPFSGYGQLDPWTPRWGLATFGLVGGMLLLLWALRKLLDILRPDLIYLEDLKTDADFSRLAAKDRSELEALRVEFAANAARLLPAGIATVDALEAEAERLYARDLSAAAPPSPEYLDARASLVQAVQWAGFTRLSMRVEAGTRRVLLGGFAALCCVALLAASIGDTKEKVDRIVPVIVNPSPSPSPPAPGHGALPPAESIVFATDRSDLDGVAIRTAARVRAVLQGRDDLGALLFASTDTRGSERLNARLAAARAAAVRHLLADNGGIARNRLPMADLATADLPMLTGPAVAEERNRSVTIFYFELPVRAGSAVPATPASLDAR